MQNVLFNCLQCLRDSLNPTDDHEGAVLATYPLKASFIIECLNPDNSWEKRHLAARVVSVLNRVYEEGKKETLTHPFIRKEPILTREDKSYKETKRILNELVKYNKSHHRSVIKNWILMCVIFTLLLVQIGLLIDYISMMISQPVFGITLAIVILFGICLMVLISVTTCLDVPCCWKCGPKNAKFSMFRNLHKFRLYFLVLYFVIILVYIVVSGYCDRNKSVDSDSNIVIITGPAICKSFQYFYLTLLAVICLTFICPVAYVFIMFVIIYCGCYRNSFNPVRSCKNYAHETIMLDIFDGNTICKGKQRQLPDNVINYHQIINEII